MIIGFSKHTISYYLWNSQEIISCNVCKKISQKLFMLNTVFNPLFKEIEQRAYCSECYGKVRKVLEGTISLILLEEKPSDCIPVLTESLISYPGNDHKGSVGCVILSDEELEKEDLSKLDTSRCRVFFDPNRNIQPGAIEHKLKVEDRILQLDNVANPEVMILPRNKQAVGEF